jgi:hypothetical protein
VHVGQVQKIQGPLVLCGSRALHATFNPQKWGGKRIWLVAMHHPILEDENKIGSLHRTILADVTDRLRCLN